MRNFAAFRYAIAGILYCVRQERNMKIHAVAALAAIFAAWQMDLSSTEWAILLISIAGVISAELFNTAIESVVDKVSPEMHPLAKAAKDAAAGAVLVQAMASLGIGYILFWNKLIKWWG